MSFKWKPSKSAKREFAQKMDEVADFCKKNNITQSKAGDSYYFEIKGQQYRVSNHSINNSVYCDMAGNRHNYHSLEEIEKTIFIRASKTKIIEIYNQIKENGKYEKK